MEKKPYELLARFNDDGTVVGVSCAEKIVVNGKDFLQDPMHLADAEKDSVFAKFAEQFSASVVAERNVLVATVETQSRVIAELTSKNDTLGAEVQRLLSILASSETFV